MNASKEQAAFWRDIAVLIGEAAQEGHLLTGSNLVCEANRCAMWLSLLDENDDVMNELAARWMALHRRNVAAPVQDQASLTRCFVRDWGRVALADPALVPPPPIMSLLRLGSSNERSVVLLQSGLSELGYMRAANGRFGASTAAAVKRFQSDHHLVADGVVGEKTWTALAARVPELFAQIAAKWLGDEDFKAAARQIDIPEAALRAVYQVESGCNGFIGLQPKILFEGHIFWRQLQAAGIDPRRHLAGNEDILFEQWTRAHYRGGLAEHERLARAVKIHEQAALESASWGLFQILGLHAARLGYPDVHAFVERMQAHEREHLDAFCRFVSTTRSKGKPLVHYLRTGDWAAFAYGYNGPGYRTNRYDERLAAAYTRNGGTAQV